MSDETIKIHGKNAMKYIQQLSTINNLTPILTRDEEIIFLKENINFISKEFNNSEINIISDEKNNNIKSKRSEPMKQGIELNP